MTLLVDLWGVWLGLWLLVGAMYAAMVRWILAHRRYGAYWRDNTWLFVVLGDALVAFAVWSLCGQWEIFVIVMMANAALGFWQIIGAMAWNAYRSAQAEDERDAQG